MREGESVCPFIYFDPGTRALYESKVSQLIDDWEIFKGDSQINSD